MKLLPDGNDEIYRRKIHKSKNIKKVKNRKFDKSGNRLIKIIIKIDLLK